MDPSMLNKLVEWHGHPIEVRISDRLGLDPVAPPKTYDLARTELDSDGGYIRFYISDWQFVAVPVFEQLTELAESEFTSTDAEGKLVYSIKRL